VSHGPNRKVTRKGDRKRGSRRFAEETVAGATRSGSWPFGAGAPGATVGQPQGTRRGEKPGSRRPRLQRRESLNSQRAGSRKVRLPRRSPRTAVKDASSLPVNKGMRVEGQTMDRITRLRFRSDCGTIGIMKKVRQCALLLTLIVTSGIQIGNSWSTRSCPVERSTARQDSSTGFPSSLQSDPRCFEQCIAPGSRRPRL